MSDKLAKVAKQMANEHKRIAKDAMSLEDIIACAPAEESRKIDDVEEESDNDMMVDLERPEMDEEDLRGSIGDMFKSKRSAKSKAKAKTKVGAASSGGLKRSLSASALTPFNTPKSKRNSSDATSVLSTGSSGQKS
eukprot:7190797-Karenia_brevis.AAC.1